MLQITEKTLAKENLALFKKSEANQVRQNQVFLNVDLRNGHSGLLEVARKAGVNIKKFPRNSGLVFINDLGNRFKWMIPAKFDGSGIVIGWLVIYYKEEHGRFTIDDLTNIPKLISGKGELALSSGVSDVLHEKLRPKKPGRQVRDVNGRVL